MWINKHAIKTTHQKKKTFYKVSPFESIYMNVRNIFCCEFSKEVFIVDIIFDFGA